MNNTIITFKTKCLHSETTCKSLTEAEAFIADKLDAFRKFAKDRNITLREITEEDYSIEEERNQYMYSVGYTDAAPYEIIEVNTEKMITIREMNAEFDKEASNLQFHIGGFSAHCSNQHNQKWDCTPNEDATPFKVRKHKDGVWRDKHGQKYRLSTRPIKFHDYNF